MANLLPLFRRWTGPYIPERIKEENKLDESAHAYIIVGMLLVSMWISLAAAAFTLVIQRSPLATAVLGALVGVACACFYYLSLRVFYRTASFSLAGNLYALPSFCGILLGVIMTGGFDSPFVGLMLTVPVLVFIMGGRVVGVAWMAIVLATISWFYHLHAQGAESRQLIDNGQGLRLWRLLNWLLVGVVLAASLWVYDLLNRYLARRLKTERNQFAFQAAHDPLTQIANRDTFEKMLREAIDRCRGGSEKAVLVYVDLDDFKQVNDRYGHNTGDQVLKAVAERIRNAVRNTDLVARLGGDEFALLLNGIQGDVDVRSILDNLVNRVASPIRTREATVEITCSIGAVVCPDHGTDPETLASYADELMYKAKERQNAFVFAG